MTAHIKEKNSLSTDFDDSKVCKYEKIKKKIKSWLPNIGSAFSGPKMHQLTKTYVNVNKNLKLIKGHILTTLKWSKEPCALLLSDILNKGLYMMQT